MIILQRMFMQETREGIMPEMVTARSVEFGKASDATWIEVPVCSRISRILQPPAVNMYTYVRSLHYWDGKGYFKMGSRENSLIFMGKIEDQILDHLPHNQSISDKAIHNQEFQWKSPLSSATYDRYIARALKLLFVSSVFDIKSHNAFPNRNLPSDNFHKKSIISLQKNFSFPVKMAKNISFGSKTKGIT